MFKVLFIDSVHPFLEGELSKAGMLCDRGEHLSEDEIDGKIADYQGLVIRSRIKLNADRLAKASNLKFIARAGSGLENIDTEYCDQNNIRYFNAPEANCKAVAEHALGMILSLFNKLHSADEEMRKGIWRREENRGLELGHRSVGIIGYGYNGSAFGALLKPFGCRILAYDKYKDVVDIGVESATLEEIQKHADVISFHVPLTDETQYYFDSEFINKMANAFYLINTSRGKVVNTTDLISGLNSGAVLGACLDVLEYEKTSFEKLVDANKDQGLQTILASDKVLFSPHVAGWTQESLFKLSEVLASKILKEFP